MAGKSMYDYLIGDYVEVLTNVMTDTQDEDGNITSSLQSFAGYLIDVDEKTVALGHFQNGETEVLMVIERAEVLGVLKCLPPQPEPDQVSTIN